MFEVVYLTGAPASGKSTLSCELRERVPSLAVFDYGDELRQHIGRRIGRDIPYDELRAASASLITYADVQSLDAHLLTWVDVARRSHPVLIDTHAVTREEYGFCVSPFSRTQLESLKPTRIVCLVVAPETTLARIDTAPAGRRDVTAFQAGFHAALQASVAATYGILIGCRIHVFDSFDGTEALAWLVAKLAPTTA